MAYSQIDLAPGMAGVGLGQVLSDVTAVLIDLPRRGQIALRHQHVAEATETNSHFALVTGLAGECDIRR